jgi:hypothetical protein
MKAAGLVAVLCSSASVAFGEAPAFYREVASVHWVVDDLLAVKQKWTELGFPAGQDFGEVALAVTHRGRATTARVRAAVTFFGGLEVVWLQPLDDQGVFAEFRARRGSGIMSLNHRVPTVEALESEVARLGALGVGVLQRNEVDTGAGILRIVHLDTEPKGKFVLGLVHGEGPALPGAPPPFGLKLSQYAFVVRDLDAVNAFWQSVGLPKIEVSRTVVHDRVYKGKPGVFDQDLGFQTHGTVAYEWIRILKGPTAYQDFLDAKGEGVHHLAFDAAALEDVAEKWKAAGVAPVQSGGWGEKGKPGSGRFAYFEGPNVGGIAIELLSRPR